MTCRIASISPTRSFDVVIVGAGGSGMRASLQLARAGLNVAVLSKVFPTRSHTVAAQGGIGASLGNMSEDNWHYHFYDTVKGSDWLGDQDAIEFMCREAPKVVYELEHFGMPFDRNPDGTIYQRPFGGHTANYGEKPVQRACAAADRTGHAMLHTLYQQNVKARTNFFVEWMALDLIRDADGDVVGVTALEMETGELHILRGQDHAARHRRRRAHLRRHRPTPSSTPATAWAWRRAPGMPLEDMEFWQFHPTGVAGAGVLLTEGCRGEGAILRNSNGERFMERYAPTLKDLAPRDFVSRCMDQEIKEGRGCGPNKDYILLDMTHLGAETIMKRLPSRVRDRPQLRQRRHHQGADPGGADDPLPDGRHPDQHPRPGGGAEGRQPERGRQRPLRGRRVRLRQRARRQPAGHQLAARPAGVRPRRRQPHRRDQRSSAQGAQAAAGRRRRPHAGAPGAPRQPAPAASTRRTSPTTSAPTMQQHAGVFRTQAMHGRRRGQGRGDAPSASKAIHLEGQVARSSTPRASRRSRSRT